MTQVSGYGFNPWAPPDPGPGSPTTAAGHPVVQGPDFIAPASAPLAGPATPAWSPPPAATAFPPPAAAPVVPPPPQHKRRRHLIIGLVSGVVVLALLAGFVGVPAYHRYQAYAAARDDFDVAAAQFTAAAHDLDTAITRAQTYVQTTDRTTLADPGLVTTLIDATAAARRIPTDVPPRAAATEAIRAQIDDLHSRLADVQEATATLTRLTDAIDESKQLLPARTGSIAAATPNQTVAVLLTDRTGLEQLVTITIGSWVRAADPTVVATAWSGVGGTSANPLADGYYGYGNAERYFDHTSAAVVFGTIRVTNLTTSRPASDFNGGDSSIFLSLNHDSSRFDAGNPGFLGDGFIQCRYYGNRGNVCDTGGQATAFTKPLIDPYMETNHWGPVPFAIAVGDVFTSDHPTGDPSFAGLYFHVSGASSAVAVGAAHASFTTPTAW